MDPFTAARMEWMDEAYDGPPPRDRLPEVFLDHTGGPRNTWLDTNTETIATASAVVGVTAGTAAMTLGVAPVVMPTIVYYGMQILYNPGTPPFLLGVAEFAVGVPGSPTQFCPRPGRPTGRDWARFFRGKYGSRKVEWSSLKRLRAQFAGRRDTVKRSWEKAWGKPWPRTPEGKDFIPHHEPALSEGGSIWDVTPLPP